MHLQVWTVWLVVALQIVQCEMIISGQSLGGFQEMDMNVTTPLDKFPLDPRLFMGRTS